MLVKLELWKKCALRYAVRIDIARVDARERRFKTEKGTN